MSRIVIVYFSGYGHTAKQADAVYSGCLSVDDTHVDMHRIDAQGEVSEHAMLNMENATAIIYGSPTYMGGPAWQFKKFAEASSRVWHAQKWKDKLAAGFTNSASVNGDKFSTIQYLWTLAQQHGQIWVGTGLLPANTMASGPEDVNWTAGFGGALAISPSDATPEEAPRSGDLQTAHMLGQRVAQLCQRFRA